MILNDHNILLQQILTDNSSFTFKEIVPSYLNNTKDQVLTRGTSGNIFWNSIDSSFNLLVNNKFSGTNIYYEEERIGLGRSPLFNYKVDIAIPRNSLLTAFHIGDGSFGFSMGNGTTNGFIPEIIGIGADENDTGLYFIGIAGNDISSNIPLIILDGRNSYNEKLNNRPIVGITSADYTEYSILIDASDNLNVKGNVVTSNVIINNISLITIIKELQEQIDYLKTKIT